MAAQQDVLAWIGAVSAGLALGGMSALLSLRGPTRSIWAAAVLPLSYAGLAEWSGPSLSGAAHMMAAFLAALALLLATRRV